MRPARMMLVPKPTDEPKSLVTHEKKFGSPNTGCTASTRVSGCVKEAGSYADSLSMRLCS
jgi:hypothetical protein